jgi:polysaccharide export outer membrane protein
MAKFLAAAAFVVLVCTAAPVGAQQPAPQGSYQLAPGDVLDVVVWRSKELSMQVTVRPDGWISFPLVSDVHVEGATATETQKTLEQALSKFVTTPMVTVIVTRIAPLKVSIVGKVRQPGRYAVEAPATVLDILALAGGPTEYAQPDLMYVLRRDSKPDAVYQQIPVRYSSSISAGKSNTNVAIAPGDIVVVP